MNLRFAWLCFLYLICTCIGAKSQVRYSTSNLHMHNDYAKSIPLLTAFHAGFGSIEADIFLHDGQLLVAHDRKELRSDRNLADMYLRPLTTLIKTRSDSSADKRKLQLLIDLKTPATPTLDTLVSLLKQFPAITNNSDISIVISGNRPAPENFARYPSYIQFDAIPGIHYPAASLERVALYSDNFRRYSKWNGKGIIPAHERMTIDSLIRSIHTSGKKIRFWNAPDFPNAWYQLMQLGVDYINTDHAVESAQFMNTLESRSYDGSGSRHKVSAPGFKSDNLNTKPRNVILLIGDGMGLAQLHAAYAANGGHLHIFEAKQTGLSKTSSADAFITDSAPGATAFSTGTKTNNRAVGVSPSGARIPNLPAILDSIEKMRTAIITTGDITDATPAAWYAANSERDSSAAILDDLLRSHIHLIIGKLGASGRKSLQANTGSYKLVDGIDKLVKQGGAKWIIDDKNAALSIRQGRGDWLASAFDKTVELLTSDERGMLLIIESAQIDHAGHNNSFPDMIEELKDFDRLVGRAMKFADRNENTLVIITGDHETGGLTLLDGNLSNGYVSGHFATNDHTAIPVPVFAYGPRSGLFTGVYENTAIFQKILQALEIKL